ncbi:response regulator transcription factor [Eggerthella timonensis]|uniref:response regulator transcription factor n=1 Tax=Eggerthella timonensis TaxID=1871008 RepID=UPI0015E0B0BD|nr:helix-turn-helix transcriptional regulator [Eggerthella timonensis]
MAFDLSMVFGGSHYLSYYASLFLSYLIAVTFLRTFDALSQRALLVCSLVAAMAVETVCVVSLFDLDGMANLVLLVGTLAALCFGQVVCVLLSYLALTTIPGVKDIVGIAIAGYFVCIPLLYLLSAFSGAMFVVALLPPAAFVCFRGRYPRRMERADRDNLNSNGKLRFYCMAAVVTMSFVVGLLTSLETKNFFNFEAVASMFVHTTMMVVLMVFMVLAAKSKLLPSLSIILISHLVTKTVNLVYYYASLHGFNVDSTAGIFLFAIGIVVCVMVYLLCFTSSFDMLALRSSDGDKRSFDAVFEEMSSRYELTHRETEVLRLLAVGRSLPYVQSELCIAEGTARSHAHNIYRKLDVHSRQELIDLVEAGGKR